MNIKYKIYCAFNWFKIRKLRQQMKKLNKSLKALKDKSVETTLEEDIAELTDAAKELGMTVNIIKKDKGGVR